MGDDIRLSVALVTCNRPSSLARTLRSLREQTIQPWETVIADDSDDERARAVRSLADEFGCRYLAGPKRGLYANRNAAALACGGTHIRTMDDDHTFPRDHLERCLTAVAGDPDSVWIIGEFDAGEKRSGEIPPCPGQLHPRGFSVTPPDPQDCWSIADGATIYPRTIFDSGVRYAEEIAFGAVFLEFGGLLHWLGYRIRQLDTTYVVHHADRSARAIDDPELEQAARVFAMLCHSFLYQPTTRNKMLTCAQIGRQLAASPVRATRRLSVGGRAFVARRAFGKALVNGRRARP